MRVRIRLLGADLLEIATGADIDNDESTGPGTDSADLTTAPAPFGFNGHDEPLVERHR